MLAMVAGNVLRSMGPVEAAKWAENLPEGALRSTAMGRIANEYARKDPAAAAAWATSYIHDEKVRLETLARAGEAWARQDYAAAEWAASSGLPEKLQQAIVNSPGKDKDRKK